MESLQSSSKVPKVMQMVHGRSEELCIVLNHEIISLCVFGRGIGGEANRKRGKFSCVSKFLGEVEEKKGERRYMVVQKWLELGNPSEGQKKQKMLFVTEVSAHESAMRWEGLGRGNIFL